VGICPASSSNSIQEHPIMALDKLGSINPAGQAFSLWNEFKAFAFKGNVIDMAVGVIIGTAFGAIVKSLVDHIIMPLVSIVMPSKEGYTGWKVPVLGADIPVGEFLGNVVNFLIVALVLFIFIVKFLGWITKSKKQEAAAPPPPTKDQELLMEIRDLLKNQSGPSPAPSVRS
jgi:large conductance mechanosensitive channel